MAATNYRIEMTEGLSSDLLAFLRNRQHLTKIAEVSQRCQPASNVWTFGKHVASAAGLPVDETIPVVRTLWNIRRGQTLSGDTPNDVVDGITRVIREQTASNPAWQAERISEWEQITAQLKGVLEQLSPDSALMISSKAQALAYRHANILKDAKIIADIRPVFDERVREIKEMVVQHTLIVDYSNDAGEARKIHLTMDSTDIAKLREQCDRADAKVKLIVQSLGDKNWPTVIFPEDDPK